VFFDRIGYNLAPGSGRCHLRRQPCIFLQRLTARGIEFGPLQYEPISNAVTDTSQACAFMFVYFLCGFLVKYYASKIFGTRPPAGAESITTIMDSPQGQKLMRQVSFDPNDLKMD
jgi:hypothetical protein